MIVTQPMANFKHTVIRIESAHLHEIQAEVDKHVALGYTIRHAIYSARLHRSISLYEAYVEKLDEVNELCDPAWRPL